MPREASAADCPRMCKIFVKGPSPMVPIGDAESASHPLVGDAAQLKSALAGLGCRWALHEARNGRGPHGAIPGPTHR
jgi:hypothetical protein